MMSKEIRKLLSTLNEGDEFTCKDLEDLLPEVTRGAISGQLSFLAKQGAIKTERSRRDGFMIYKMVDPKRQPKRAGTRSDGGKPGRQWAQAAVRAAARAAPCTSSLQFDIGDIVRRVDGDSWTAKVLSIFPRLNGTVVAAVEFTGFDGHHKISVMNVERLEKFRVPTVHERRTRLLRELMVMEEAAAAAGGAAAAEPSAEPQQPQQEAPDADHHKTND